MRFNAIAQGYCPPQGGADCYETQGNAVKTNKTTRIHVIEGWRLKSGAYYHYVLLCIVIIIIMIILFIYSFIYLFILDLGLRFGVQCPEQLTHDSTIQEMKRTLGNPIFMFFIARSAQMRAASV